MPTRMLPSGALPRPILVRILHFKDQDTLVGYLSNAVIRFFGIIVAPFVVLGYLVGGWGFLFSGIHWSPSLHLSVIIAINLSPIIIALPVSTSPELQTAVASRICCSIHYGVYG